MFEHDLGLARIILAQVLNVLDDFTQNTLVSFAEIELSSLSAS